VDGLDDPGTPGAPGTHESIDRRRARALVAMARAYMEHPGTGRGTEPELIVHVDAVALAEHLADVPPCDARRRNLRHTRRRRSGATPTARRFS
jgi:hypothetical protein